MNTNRMETVTVIVRFQYRDLHGRCWRMHSKFTGDVQLETLIEPDAILLTLNQEATSNSEKWDYVWNS